MKVKASNKAASMVVECFLYAVVIIEAAIAAFAYKPMGRMAQQFPGAMAYFGTAYLCVLGLAFLQLHRMHRERKRAALQKAAQPAPQLSEVAVARVSAPPSIDPEPSAYPGMSAGEVVTAAQPTLLLGLTRAQLAVVLLVFLAALKIFSWALAKGMKP